MEIVESLNLKVLKKYEDYKFLIRVMQEDKFYYKVKNDFIPDEILTERKIYIDLFDLNDNYEKLEISNVDSLFLHNGSIFVLHNVNDHCFLKVSEILNFQWTNIYVGYFNIDRIINIYTIDADKYILHLVSVDEINDNFTHIVEVNVKTENIKFLGNSFITDYKEQFIYGKGGDLILYDSKNSKEEKILINGRRFINLKELLDVEDLYIENIDWVKNYSLIHLFDAYTDNYLKKGLLFNFDNKKAEIIEFIDYHKLRLYDNFIFLIAENRITIYDEDFTLLKVVKNGLSQQEDIDFEEKEDKLIIFNDRKQISIDNDFLKLPSK